MLDKQHAFKGEYFFLSNMYPCSFEVNGQQYNSSEQYYQASKTLVQSERSIILNCTNPQRTKALGKAVTLRSDWDKVKDTVMYQALNYKFQNKELAKRLLDTDDLELVEYNYWKDVYWGVYNGKGENKLGTMLMQIRSRLYWVGETNA